jgi:hypothetical protein
MQGNGTNIIVVTDEVGLVGQKIRTENLDMYSRLKDFVEEKSVEISDTIKNHLVFF